MNDMISVNEYAKALFDLTEELGTTEAVREDVLCARKIFLSNPEYARLLDTPAIKKEERLSLIDGAFSCFDEMLVNLIKIVAQEREVYRIDKLLSAYLEKYDASRGIERVKAITGVVMDTEQLSAMREKLEKMTGKTVVIENEVDSSVLGGVKLSYMGRQLDGSLKSRLDFFERKLRETVL